MGRPRKLRFSGTAQNRACLCCRQVFVSAGAHNRLCDSCRGRDDNPFEPATVASVAGIGPRLTEVSGHPGGR